MAQPVRDSFVDLERHRIRLEENIEKLRKSLRHWQIWEAEYEGLKEEILSHQPPPSEEQLAKIAEEYEGTQLNQKELLEILGSPTRSPAQIVNLLDRRIDYVEQNSRSLLKQIEAAETKLAAATVISEPDVRNEEGLPISEIVEELDEEGNVISGRVISPGDTQPQLLEVLKKAGIHDLQQAEGSSRAQDVSPIPVSAPEAKGLDKAALKKGVKFTEDTKPGPELEKSKTAKRVETIMEMARQNAIPSTEPPIIPTDESPEDAALRQEMLKYGMSEVGAVVAELNLEEDSDWSDEGYEDDEEEDSDEEDGYGRSTRPYIDDELRQQMMELEQRLGVRMMENVGPKPEEYDVVNEGLGRVSINKETERPSNETSPKPPIDESKEEAAKKSVRFSDKLDVSPAPKPALKPSTSKSAPISDIVEHTTPAAQAEAPKPKKASLFKQARAGSTITHHIASPSQPVHHPSPSLALRPAKPSAPKPFSGPIQYPPQVPARTTPTGPKDRIIASEIIERDVPLDTNAVPPDEIDPDLLHQEVATEYHKVRNRMIQKQGGFMKENESEIIPRTEEDGGPKKMSRFKAARLGLL